MHRLFLDVGNIGLKNTRNNIFILGKKVFIYGGVRALERLSIQLCSVWGCEVRVDNVVKSYNTRIGNIRQFLEQCTLHRV